MPIYFHSCLCSYLSRVPILVEDTVYIYIKCVFLQIPVVSSSSIHHQQTLLHNTVNANNMNKGAMLPYETKKYMGMY